MTPLQILVLVIFAAVTFCNTFLQQPGVELPPEIRAALVALNVTMFFAALNLKQFAELGKSSTTPDIITPLAPAMELSPATLVAVAKPTPVVARVPAAVVVPPCAPAGPAESPPPA